MAKAHHPAATTRAALMVAVHEYVLIVFPVAMYVAFEAIRQESFGVFMMSPEWSIATIFLAFQGLALFSRHLHEAGRRPFEPAMGLFGMICLAIIVAAAVNAYTSLPARGEHHGAEFHLDMAVGFRLVLLLLASVAFVVLVGGGKLAHLRREGGAHGT